MTTAKEIIAEVACRHGVSITSVYGGGGQSAAFVKARSEAALLMRRDLRYSLPQIGRILRLHHTSVLAAVRRADPHADPAAAAERRPTIRELTVRALRFDQRMAALEARVEALEARR